MIMLRDFQAPTVVDNGLREGLAVHATRQIGVVLVGSKGNTTGGSVPGGRYANVASARELTWARRAAWVFTVLKEVAHDAGARDGARLLPLHPVRLPVQRSIRVVMSFSIPSAGMPP